MDSLLDSGVDINLLDKVGSILIFFQFFMDEKKPHMGQLRYVLECFWFRMVSPLFIRQSSVKKRLLLAIS
jgi:hypothetical protein